MSFSSASLAKCIRRLIPVFSLLCAAIFVGFSYSEVAATPTTDVTTGLVAYWNFNNASAIGQSTTGGTPLTANNGAQYTASGKFGGGLLLNGASQMLTSATRTIDNLPIGKLLIVPVADVSICEAPLRSNPPPNFPLAVY